MVGGIKLYTKWSSGCMMKAGLKWEKVLWILCIDCFPFTQDVIGTYEILLD